MLDFELRIGFRTVVLSLVGALASVNPNSPLIQGSRVRETVQHAGEGPSERLYVEEKHLDELVSRLIGRDLDVDAVMDLCLRVTNSTVVGSQRLQSLTSEEQETLARLTIQSEGDAADLIVFLRIRVDDPASLLDQGTGAVIFEWSTGPLTFNEALPGVEETYLSAHTKFVKGQLEECGIFAQSMYHKVSELYDIVRDAEGLLIGSSYRWVKTSAHWTPFMLSVEPMGADILWKHTMGDPELLPCVDDGSPTEVEAQAVAVTNLLLAEKALIASLRN